MLDKYGFGWYSNDYITVTGDEDAIFPGAEMTQYGRYERFDLRLLQLFQAHTGVWLLHLSGRKKLSTDFLSKVL